MTQSSGHIEIEDLSAWVDGELGPEEAASVERHVVACERCGEQLRLVRGLVRAAGALPRDTAPPPEVWTGLRARLAVGRRRAWWPGTAAVWLAAAAVVLVVSIPLLMREPGASAPSAPADPAPVVVAAVEASYATTVADLRRTLASQRATLAPSTVRVVEHSLAVIDSAITEARAALASDPANRALVEILAAQYERKVDLLQRATKLSPSL